MKHSGTERQAGFFPISISSLGCIVALALITSGVVSVKAVGANEPASAARPSAVNAPSETLREEATIPDAVLRIQGPAIDTPQEIFEMLNQRQRALDKREEAVRAAEARLATLRGEIEKLLARQEQSVKATQASRQTAKSKQGEEEAAAKSTVQQVAKIYETMPPEEAAARLEKLPMEKSLQVLRSLKGKTAGAILALVKPDKAAKLTEQFLASSPAPKPTR